MESCKTCKWYIDHYTSIIETGIQIAVLSISGNTIGWRRVATEVENEPGTGICNNEYSELSGCGVHDGGWCEYYMKKTNNSDKSKDPFEVFRDYKCDGQLVMDLSNSDKITIHEETKEKAKEKSKSKVIDMMEMI